MSDELAKLGNMCSRHLDFAYRHIRAPELGEHCLWNCHCRAGTYRGNQEVLNYLWMLTIRR